MLLGLRSWRFCQRREARAPKVALLFLPAVHKGMTTVRVNRKATTITTHVCYLDKVGGEQCETEVKNNMFSIEFLFTATKITVSSFDFKLFGNTAEGGSQPQ